MSRPAVFISYSHKDEKLLGRLLPYLELLQRDELAEIWADTKIEGGDRWLGEVEQALNSASVAVLLISQSFLASRFVYDEELPRIFRRQSEGTLVVLPVFLSPSTVTSTTIQFTGGDGIQRAVALSDFQGFGTPEKTIKELPPSERDRLFLKLHNRIRDLARSHPAEPPTVRISSETAERAGSVAGTPGFSAAEMAAELSVAAPAMRSPTSTGPANNSWIRYRGLAAMFLFGVAAVAAVIHGKAEAITGSDGLAYRRIHAATFDMGCDGPACEPDELPVRHVTITADFFMSEVEVTVGAYQQYASKTGRPMPPQDGRQEANSAAFNPGWRERDHPIVNVNHTEASAYCRWVVGAFPWQHGALPTEAQWEFAARGGIAGQSFPWGNSILRDKANYGFKDPNTGAIYPRASETGARDQWLYTSPVRSFDANAFGLYDVVGNVQEWTRDAYRAYDLRDLTDPFAPPLSPSDERVVRGGSFLYDQQDCRVENRSKNPPIGRYSDTGFRCMLPAGWGTQ